jgi:hypothetical protein
MNLLIFFSGVALFIENIYTPGIQPISSLVAGGLIGTGLAMLVHNRRLAVERD